MKLFKSKKRAAAIGAVAAISIVGGSVAYGYWTTTGIGDGSATTGTSTAFTVDLGDVETPALTPGGPTQIVPVTVTNPSTGIQRLRQVEVRVALANGDPWTPAGGCTAADFSINGENAGEAATITTTQDLAPNGGSSTGLSVTVQMVETGDNQDGCKQKVVPLYAVAG
jgi:hypothetical protein